MCDYCANFYHPNCLGLMENEVKSLNSCKCPDCFESSNNELLYVLHGYLP